MTATTAIVHQFQKTVHRASKPHVFPSDWPVFEPVPAMLASCETALRLGTVDPDILTDYYGVAMPNALLEQLCSANPPSALLWRPLDLAQLPRLRTALTGAFAALRSCGLSPTSCFGAASPDALIKTKPTLAHLYADALFGSGIPMIGASPQHGDVIDRCQQSHNPDTALDLWLSGNILHERCHGRRGSSPSQPDSWMLQECASIHLGWTAYPAHVLPNVPGEAVPAGAPFLMVALALAHHLSARTLWDVGLLGGKLARHVGPRIRNALMVAEWQCLRAQRRPQFAPDGDRPMDWIKLLDAAYGPSPLDDALDALAALDAPLAPGGPVTHGPDLLMRASQLTWPELPWYHAPVTEADRDLVQTAVRGLFRVNRYETTFQTLPDPLPNHRFTLDLATSQLLAEVRPYGVYDEPARWLFPPPLTRCIAERGAETLTITGATLANATRIADFLVEMAQTNQPLKQQAVVHFGV